DNLPVVLVPRVLELCSSSLERISRIGLGIDLRERQFFVDYPRVLDELRHAGYRLEVLFFDASDDVLVRRFSETRRPPPPGRAAPRGALQAEPGERVELRAPADRIIDTSALPVHQLREELQRLYRGPGAADTLTLLLVSFGYKFGLPTDADMVLDARFLANP